MQKTAERIEMVRTPASKIGSAGAKLCTIAVAAVGAVLLVAPAAFAEPTGGAAQTSPSLEAYSGPGGAIQTEIEPSPEPTPPEPIPPLRRVEKPQEASAKLPFTGLDLGLVGAAGGVLLMLGFGIRRLIRAPDLA